uniref:Histone chaperone ASF1like protein putative n=1 Tax=Albugo laibachii Nc14 TaxID=890382 RepID=F0WG56_9STRA|nr:histone chaperone ASF1like protein putative [Albugo laibachii Nc14]|eukprot:CCA20191.1 histone chaperone ASF1like protein putative [Albugo laibachii Nc14]
MAFVTLTNITVLANPTAFTNPFQFEVTFECAHALEDDLEWKITYVGSAEDESRDQVLEEVLVGPVPVGTNKFVFQSEPPNPDMIPDCDKIGVTVVLLTCSYRSKEFVRVGYYVNNDYADPLMLENPPPTVDVSKLQRNILADKPRVTRFPIDWSSGLGGGNMDCVGMTGSSEVSNIELDSGFVDENILKAAAHLDSNYPDIVIDGDEGMEWLENNQLENEVDDEDIDLEGDETMDQDEEIDLEEE